MNPVVVFLIGVLVGALVVHLCYWLRQREPELEHGDVVIPAGLQVRDAEDRVFTVTVDHRLPARDTRGEPEDH